MYDPVRLYHVFSPLQTGGIVFNVISIITHVKFKCHENTALDLSYIFRDARCNKSDVENTISLKIMNNDNEKSPRHFLKIPDEKLTIHFIRPNVAASHSHR